MLVWDNISYKNSIKSKQAMATALGTEFSSVVLFTLIDFSKADHNQDRLVSQVPAEL